MDSNSSLLPAYGLWQPNPTNSFAFYFVLSFKILRKLMVVDKMPLWL